MEINYRAKFAIKIDFLASNKEKELAWFKAEKNNIPCEVSILDDGVLLYARKSAEADQNAHYGITNRLLGFMKQCRPNIQMNEDGGKILFFLALEMFDADKPEINTGFNYQMNLITAKGVGCCNLEDELDYMTKQIHKSK